MSAIYAHPDDETFSAGGTFAKYAASGHRLTLLCATDGDAGKATGVEVNSRAELAAVRRRELRDAAKVLGFARVESLGFADGALGDVNQDELIGRIVRHLRRERTQVVITFGPEGAPNTHHDHKVISRAATAAFHLAGNSSVYPEHLADGAAAHVPTRLFYVTWPDPEAGAELKTLGLPATARVDVRRFLGTERAAWEAHRSQHALQQRFEQLAATEEEWFALVAGIAQPSPVISDLFEGLEP